MIRKSFKFVTCLLITCFSLCTSPLAAQQAESVHWLTFEQLEDSLAVNPKPVFIDFYTDWCTYCLKMDRVVFTKEAIVKELNTNYYAVRFDAETSSEVVFGGRKFINDQVGKVRSPVHQLAQLLALREGQFAPPTIVILNEDFSVTARYFEYMSSRKLLSALK